MSGKISRRGFTFGALSTSALTLAGCGNWMLARMRADNSGFVPVSYSFETTDVCALNAQSTSGPFHLPGAAVRRNIAESKPGVPLRVRFKVVDVKGCQPIAGAAIDVWHCDALGVYAGYEEYGPDSGAGIPMIEAMSGHVEHTDEKRYCRGIQLSDARGMVEFETILPGWYTGRTPHIHVHAHLPEADGGAHVFTNQVYFPDDLMARIYTTIEPYAQRGRSSHTNADDMVIHDSDGADGGFLRMTEHEEGYAGSLTLAIPI